MFNTIDDNSARKFSFFFFFFHFKAANGKRILRIEREKRRLARRKSSSCLFSSTRFEGSRLTSRDSPRRDTTFLFSRQIIVLYTPLPRFFAPRFKDILRYLFILGRAPAFYPAWKGDQRERERILLCWPPAISSSPLNQRLRKFLFITFLFLSRNRSPFLRKVKQSKVQGGWWFFFLPWNEWNHRGNEVLSGTNNLIYRFLPS